MASFQTIKSSVTQNGTSIIQMGAEDSNDMMNVLDAEPSRQTVSHVAVTLLKKSVSSLVVCSYLVLIMGNAYSMQVAPDNVEEMESRGCSIPLKQRKASPNSIAPLELDSTTSGLLSSGSLQAIESGKDVSTNTRDLLVLTSVGLGGSSAGSLSSNAASMHESKKETTDRLKILSGNDSRKVHPLQIEQRDVDIETGLLNTPIDQANEKEKDEEDSIPVINDATLDIESGHKLPLTEKQIIKRDLENYLKEVTRTDYNQRDILQLLGGVLLAGALSTEIAGEIRLWVNSFVNAFASTYVGFEYFFINPEGDNLSNQLISAQTWNLPIALAPFVAYRSYEFIKLLTPSTAEMNVKKKFSLGQERIGASLVLLAAFSMAAMTALQYYSGDIVNNPKGAKTYSPFILMFYLVDNYLRYNDLKNSIYNYMFISRTDAPNISDKRHFLREELRKTKVTLAKNHRMI